MSIIIGVRCEVQCYFYLKKKTIKVSVSCVYFFLLLVANTNVNMRVLDDARVFASTGAAYYIMLIPVCF